MNDINEIQIIKETQVKSADSELVKRFKAGEEKAFNEIVLNYQDRLFNIAYRMLGNFEETKDVVQDTFVKAYSHLKTFKEESSVYTWLCSIALNSAKNRLRTLNKEKEVHYSLDEPDIYQDGEKAREITDPSFSALEVLENEERDNIVQKALNKLGSEFKTMIILHDVQGLSYEAIAKICKCPVGTVRSRLHRGRLILKELLNQEVSG